MLGAVFLMGQGLVPAEGLPPAPEVGPEALPVLHEIAIKGSCPDVDGDAEALEAAGLVVATAAGLMLTEAGHARHGELLAAQRESVDLGETLVNFEILLRRLLRENMRLETDYGADTPLVRIDKGQLDFTDPKNNVNTLTRARLAFG